MSRSAAKEKERVSVPGGVTYVTQHILNRIRAGEYAPEAESIVKRLYMDARMEGVWDQLLRQKRGRFAYPAQKGGLNPFNASLETLHKRCGVLKKFGDRASMLELKRIKQKASHYKRLEQKTEKRISELSDPERQEMACMWLYLVALTKAFKAKAILTSSDLSVSEAIIRWAGLEVPDSILRPDRFEVAAEVLSGLEDKSPGFRVFTNSDIEAAADYLQSSAEELSRVASRASLLLGGTEVDVDEVVRSLHQKARFVLSMQGSNLHVRRNRSDGATRAFVIELNEIMRGLFGSSMYGTAATVVNVALDREDMTGPRIRELVRKD